MANYLSWDIDGALTVSGATVSGGSGEAVKRLDTLIARVERLEKTTVEASRRAEIQRRDLVAETKTLPAATARAMKLVAII